MSRLNFMSLAAPDWRRPQFRWWHM